MNATKNQPLLQARTAKAPSVEILPPAPSNITVIQPPEGPKSLATILADLSRPFPKCERQRRQGGKNITYIPWYKCNQILDKYAPGWSGRITSVITTSERIFVAFELTIPTIDGPVTRGATGTELLKEEVTDKETGETIIRELAYGDPSSNAESQAFRRSAARFNLGLCLYEKH